MSDISFNAACKELKIAQIAQLNQLFQLLHLAHINGHCFYLVSRMLISKNVNNGVSKDSPISSDRRFLKSAFFLEQYGVGAISHCNFTPLIQKR